MRALPILFAVSACGGDTALPIEAHCNPLGAAACLTPWPSSVYETTDLASPTGRRLAIPGEIADEPTFDVPTDPLATSGADGFAPTEPIVMTFDTYVSTEGLPTREHSVAADSPTVLLDLTTGQRVAHTVQVQPRDGLDGDAVVFVPAYKLAAGHRYAVAITDRVHDTDGDELAVPPGFAALRDARRTDHERLEDLRPRFADVLEALEAAGYPADDLVIAWDFTVASR